MAQDLWKAIILQTFGVQVSPRRTCTEGMLASQGSLMHGSAKHMSGCRVQGIGRWFIGLPRGSLVVPFWDYFIGF